MTVVRRLLGACTASPVRTAATAAAITPGAHLLLSVLVERRRVSWSTEYPAVIVGDPVLALAAGVSVQVAGAAAVSASPLLRRPLAPVVAGAAVAFGVWQLRDELRRGVYNRHQAFSPSKLWHQFVVYPALSSIIPAAVLAATGAAVAPAASRRQRVGAALAWAGVATWGALTVEAIRHPRPGHGAFDWRRFGPAR